MAQKSYTVPYVNARVVRDPMCVSIKSVLAHEVFVLMAIFQEVQVLGPKRDAKGRIMTKTVEPGMEYQRLANLYGSDRENDKLRVEEAFGPPHSSAWRDALAGGLDNFEVEGDEEVEEPNNAESGSLESIIQQMMLQDPDRKKKAWWIGDGQPDLAELKRRTGRSVSAAERDEAYESVQAAIGGGDNSINAPAVMARLDDLDVEYDPDADPADLVNLLHESTVSQIQALGGTVGDGDSLEALSQQLDELRDQEDVA